MAEEDGVDRHVVALCQELDDAIRRRVEFGGHDRELLLGVEDVRKCAAEVRGEGSCRGASRRPQSQGRSAPGPRGSDPSAQDP